MSSHLTFGMVIGLVLLLCAVTTTQAAFTSTPTSVNATLGSTANFTCSASRGSITWNINGFTLSELNTKAIETNSVGSMSILHIPATEEYNNTNVNCSIFILGEGFLDSDPVMLQVQGLLAAPGNISIILLNTTMATLTWSPPFTLNITGAMDILGYMVYITDNNISSTSHEFVNNTQYTFIIEEYQEHLCHRYSFQVSAVNEVGEGNRSSDFECPGTSSSDTLIHPSGVSIQPSSVSRTQESLTLCGSNVLFSSPCPESNAVGLAIWIGSGIATGCTLMFISILVLGLGCFLVLKKSRKSGLQSEIKTEDNEAYVKPANLYNMVENSAYEFTSRHIYIKRNV